MSQGLLGSPHLTANHRHVQPFAGAGKDRGGTPGALPQPPVPTRHRHYLIPTEEQEPCRGRETPAPTMSSRWDSREHSHKPPFPWPRCQGCALALLWLHGTAERQPRAGKWRLPSPATRDAQPEQGPEHCTQLPGTDRQTDRRGQAAAIPAPPAWKNSRRLDPDQVFPQVLFDMNIKGASQIPSTVRGLKNP